MSAALAIVVSPTAGEGRRLATEARLRAGLSSGRTAEFLHPGSLAELASMVHAVAARGDCMLGVAGGDGTIHHVVNALGDRPVALLLIPTGSGNDFCRGLGVPGNTAAAMRLLEHGVARAVDLIEVNGRRVCTVAGLGIVADTGVQVARLLAPGSPWRRAGRALGASAYTGAGLLRVAVARRIAGRATLRWRTAEGSFAEREGRFHGVFLANVPTLGAGLRLRVPSRLDDGRLELAILPEASRARLARGLARLSRDRPLPPGVLDVVQTSEVEIVWRGGSALLGDGEPIDHSDRFHVRVLPGALRVVAP